jgi:hypothetical protein
LLFFEFFSILRDITAFITHESFVLIQEAQHGNLRSFGNIPERDPTAGVVQSYGSLQPSQRHHSFRQGPQGTRRDNKGELRSIYELAVYFSSYIPNLAMTADPL